MKKTITKEDRLKQDHKRYNAQFKTDRRLQMSFTEYKQWVMGTAKLPRRRDKSVTISKPIWAVTTDHIPSVMSKSKAELSRTSMVEKVKTGVIDGDAALEIISKSKRISIAYSKGSYQYITEGTDLKTIGKKTQGM